MHERNRASWGAVLFGAGGWPLLIGSCFAKNGTLLMRLLCGTGGRAVVDTMRTMAPIASTPRVRCAQVFLHEIGKKKECSLSNGARKRYTAHPSLGRLRIGFNRLVVICQSTFVFLAGLPISQ